MALDPNVVSAIKSSGTTRLINNATGKVDFYIPFSNKTTVTLKGSSVSAKAAGENYVNFSNASTCEIDMACEVSNLDLYALSLGTTVETGNKEILQREVFGEKEIVDGGSGAKTVTIKGEPYGNKVQVFALKTDVITQIKELTATLADHTVTITDLPTDCKNICVYYYETKECRHAKIKSIPDLSTTYTFDSLVEAKGGNKEGDMTLYNLILDKVTVQNEMTFNFDAEKPSDINFKLTASKTEEGLGDLIAIPLTK